MPRRSSVYGLPPEVRRRVEEQIVQSGWAGYQRIAEQLRAEGYEVSPAALQRYGAALRDRHERVLMRVKFATELAQALAGHGSPEANPVPDATTAILQAYLFDLLMALQQEGSSEPDRLQLLWKAAQVLAALRRSDQMRVRTEAELRALAAQKLMMTDDEARRRGLDPETVRRIREEIYGIEQSGHPAAAVPAPLGD